MLPNIFTAAMIVLTVLFYFYQIAPDQRKRAIDKRNKRAYFKDRYKYKAK